MKLSYLNLATTDPAWNLAAEQYVFDCLPRDRMYVMLWQNDNAIIVGKYQNTLAEINRAFVEEHGIRVVRRLSGGGAVYHDLGNLNYTFISDAGNEPTVNFRVFCEPVVQALARLGVTAEINGRNDITIDERKFSGNAQYLREGRVMHHGTILFDAKLDTVQQALQVVDLHGGDARVLVQHRKDSLVTCVIWYPFFKVSDNMALAEEQAAATEALEAA
jgi:lipoate-protein ligase A